MMQKATIKVLAAAICLTLTVPLTAVASTEDIDRLNKIIEELPAEADLTEEQADDIKEAMELYLSLTTAEKLKIESYGKLEKEYEKLLDDGLIRDEKKEKESEEQKEYNRQRRAFLIGYDRSVPRLRQASHCIQCGQCNPHCPQRIDIPREMRRIDEYVETLKREQEI